MFTRDIVNPNISGRSSVYLESVAISTGFKLTLYEDVAKNIFITSHCTILLQKGHFESYKTEMKMVKNFITYNC